MAEDPTAEDPTAEDPGAEDPKPSRRFSAKKLDHLMRTVHPAGRGPYSYAEVARAIGEGGGQISATYIWQLRTGVKNNPTVAHLNALADFFGVRPSYFLDDDESERVDAGLALLTTLRDAGARQVAARLPGLSDDSLEALGQMAELLRRREGLSDAAAEQPPDAAAESPPPSGPEVGEASDASGSPPEK
jgi:transcriptional regulator with XRE-family HTH domain